MTASSGAAEKSWSFTYYAEKTPSNTSATVVDNGVTLPSGAHPQKAWTFSTAQDATATLTTVFQEGDTASAVLARKEYTWTTSHLQFNYGPAVAGAPYVGTLVSKVASSSGTTQTRTDQVQDTYGNLLQSKIYDYPGTTLSRTYDYYYLHNTSTDYLDNFIVNRLMRVMLGTTTLMFRVYDALATPLPCGYMVDSNASNNHDSTYGTARTRRGNVTGAYGLNYSNGVCTTTDTAGVPVYSADGNGHYVSILTNADSQYSLPGVITPNGNSAMSTSMTYTSSFAVATMTGLNGAQSSTTYDAYGRPASSTIPDGATATYAYTYPPTQLPTQTTTVNGRWTKTTLDGFGRVIQVDTGHGAVSLANTITRVVTQYAPCGCSPLGKLWRVSKPYDPNVVGSTVPPVFNQSNSLIGWRRPTGRACLRTAPAW